MSQRVTTQYGPGVIVATETVRGHTQHKVEGEGFSVWLSEAAIPDFGFMQWDETPRVIQDNSTTLPYNPQPQHYPHSGESTIQPGQQVDTDKRLSPADSVSFKPRSLPDKLPSTRNFAAATSMDELSPELQQTVNFAHSHAYDWAIGEGFDPDDAENYASYFARYVMDIEEMPEVGHPSMSRDWLSDVHGGEDPRYASVNVEEGEYAVYDSDVTDPQYPGGVNVPEDHAASRSVVDYSQHSLADVQARLGEKYIDIPVDVDRSSLQARLDNDPVRVVSDIKMRNYEVRNALDPKIGRALDLEDADHQIREAAWADVRAKATRIRRSGGVQLEAANPTAIVATVTGDHGVYTVAVLRGSALAGSSAVSEWSCSCFPAGTPVTMANGTRKSIEDVREGDMVLTAEGNTKRVARTMNKRYTGDLYGFTTASFTGERIWSTDDHPWYVLPQARCADCARNFYFARCNHVDRTAGDFMEARDIREGMYLKLPKMNVSGKDVEIDLTDFMESYREVEGMVQAVKTTHGRFFGREGSISRRSGRPLPHRVLVDESLAYAFGLFIGDGHTHNDDEIGFTFGGHEMPLAERLRDILTEKFGVNVTIRGPRGDDNTVLVRAYSTTVQKLFRHFCGTGSHTKRIHESLMQAGDEVASGLIEGWKDSDNCVSVNRDLINQFRILFTRLGVVTKVYRSAAAGQHNDLAGHNGKDIWSIGYKFGNSKKSSKNFMEADGQYSQINSIETREFDGTVYNFEVEDDHTYVVGEYAVHNCPWGDWAFERQHTFVGRLCSHAYAALQELRSLTMKKDKPRDWSHKAERKQAGELDKYWESNELESNPALVNKIYPGDFIRDNDVLGVGEVEVQDIQVRERNGQDEAVIVGTDERGHTQQLYFKMGVTSARHEDPDGELSTIPGTLTPDLNFVPKSHERRRVDVTASDHQAEWEAYIAANPEGTVEAFLSEPFEGSGSDQPESFGTSEEFVNNHERPFEDIDGPEHNPVVRNNSDVVANSHEASLGYLLEGSNQDSGDIATMAEQFLQRTAGRSFTLSEQQELIDEDAIGGPIEASDLDLRGTHYL